jgi:hypothetical protein
MKEAERALSVRREIQFSQYEPAPARRYFQACAAKGLRRVFRWLDTLAPNR